MKVLALLFAYGQSSPGLATPIRDTPRDDFSIWKSIASVLPAQGSPLSSSAATLTGGAGAGLLREK